MSGRSLTQSNASRNAANNQPSSPFVVEEGDSEAEEEVCAILQHTIPTDISPSSHGSSSSSSSTRTRLHTTSIDFANEPAQKKRKTQRAAFVSTYSNILENSHSNINYRKSWCRLSKQAYERRENEGLCHLLAISGYKVPDIKSIEKIQVSSKTSCSS